MSLCLPEYVKNALDTLERAGFEAFAVGGCVRDSLLGRLPKDWDVTTSARPGEIARCFERFKIIETGLKHGTLTVAAGADKLEITTYRTESGYSDNRHPDRVFFTRDLKSDLARRDFTMNALAYNPKTGIADFFCGMRDIAAKTIRCVGAPGERFREDALRILRALRFASELGFSLEKETAEAVLRHKDLLANVAKERVAVEFDRLLTGALAAGVLEDFFEVIGVFFPRFEKTALETLKNTPPDLTLRLAALLGASDADAGASMRALKYDNKRTAEVKSLVAADKEPLPRSKAAVKRFLRDRGTRIFSLLVALREARGENAAAARENFAKIKESGECFSLPQLAVSGKDLLGAGIEGGKPLGHALSRLLDEVIDGKLPNEKAALISAARERGFI